MKKSNNFYIFCRFLLFIFLKTFFFFKSSGRENLPKKGGCIIASNHLSYFDPIVLSVASPRILSFMSKKELFKQRFFARLITALNAFPLERDTADLKSIRFAINLLKDGGTLIIFPEGTRSRGGDIKDPLPGVSMLAAKAKVPVIPTFIEGTDNAMPVEKKKICFFKPISVQFSKPLFFTQKESNSNLKADYERFSQEIIAEIKKIKTKE